MKLRRRPRTASLRLAALLAFAATASALLVPSAQAAPTATKARAAHRGGCAFAHGNLHSRASVLRSERRLRCLINRSRASYGLRPLRANRCLHRVAARHAHDMVHQRYFAHVSRSGLDPAARAKRVGYVPRFASWLVGENIAWGVARAAKPAWVENAWMHSPGHRANILNSHFRDVGVGVAPGVPISLGGRWRLRATVSVEFGAENGHTSCRARRAKPVKRVKRHRRRSSAHARHHRHAKGVRARRHG